MIGNKLISIVMDNQFDKGWTLFSPACFEVDRNWSYKKVELSSVIRLITFSTQVNLILSEACLPLRVVEELEWSNKYIKINIIAKNQEIVDRYKQLTFSTCKIDETININYMGITGKNNGNYIFSDTLYEVDDSIDRIYFNHSKDSDYYASLEHAKKIIVCNNDKHKEFNNLLSLSKEYGLQCSYIIDEKHFDRAVYDFAKENNIELFVSSFVEDVVLIINKDDSICKVTVLTDGHIVFCPIERISNFVGELYKNLFLEDDIEVDKIPADVYSCFNGKNSKLNIEDAVVIKKDVNISEMSDFINEIFDKSITEKHNDYSNRAKNTQYFFTLIPPLFDYTYSESSIYLPLHDLHNKWNELNKIKFDRIVSEYREFMNKDVKLIGFIFNAKNITNRINQMISSRTYNGYYSLLKEATNIFEEYRSCLFEDCSSMFKDINSERTDTKFDKFDVEIEGYRKTIKEKEALVFMGTDVLSNKRRIEILNKKIEDLLALKEKFESGSLTRLDKETDSFVEYCKQLVNAVSITDDTDSIGKIVNTNAESKLAKLNIFVSNYLKAINDYLTGCISCLKNMQNILIPEEYMVFEKDNQRYIVIHELNEYDSTKELREEFSLKCLARR